MKIKFYKVKTLSGGNERRSLNSFFIPKNIKLPFEPHHFQDIKPTSLALKKKIILGNHYHPLSSGRWESHIVLGKENIRLFKFWHKEGKKIKERYLKNGDATLIPPGISHAFLPLTKDAKLFELSNILWKIGQSIEDKLV